MLFFLQSPCIGHFILAFSFCHPSRGVQTSVSSHPTRLGGRRAFYNSAHSQYISVSAFSKRKFFDNIKRNTSWSNGSDRFKIVGEAFTISHCLANWILVQLASLPVVFGVAFTIRKWSLIRPSYSLPLMTSSRYLRGPALLIRFTSLLSTRRALGQKWGYPSGVLIRTDTDSFLRLDCLLAQVR